MYTHAKFQDANIYNKKVTRDEAELFDQPSYDYIGLIVCTIM